METEIESIAAGGEGVGRLPDGRAVFVQRTAPGDRVEVALTAEHPRWARGRVVTMRHPSELRRDPPCVFQADCGGCALEHLQYPAQLQAKARIVADALTRIARRDVEEPEVVASPREFRYRNRVSFTLRRLPDGPVAGFHRASDPDRILDIDGRCLLPESPISEAWDALRKGWGRDAGHLPGGRELRLTLRATSGGAVSLLVENGESTGDPDTLLAAVPALRSIWHRPRNGEMELLAGDPVLTEHWGGGEIELGGAAFLQVNREAGALLEDWVAERAGPAEGTRVVDAYCGVGLLADRLAASGAEVVGIELDAEAVRAARTRSAARFVAGRVEDFLSDELPADLLIVNPPRPGLDPAVVDAITRQPPPRLIYISCNPATLARDIARLGEGYEIRSIRSFDLFPQTAHVETVVELVRHSEGEE